MKSSNKGYKEIAVAFNSVLSFDNEQDQLELEAKIIMAKFLDRIQEIADQKAIVTALQAHVDALSKKRDQLLRDLRNASSATAKKAPEFPVGTSVTETVAPVKKKKVYKRKPKAKVTE